MKIILSIELCVVMRKRFVHLSKPLRFLGYRRVKELEYRDSWKKDSKSKKKSVTRKNPACR